MEEEFDYLKYGIRIVPSQLQTEKVQIDSDIQGVGFKMRFHRAISEKIHSGIHVLQGQDNHIVGETTDLLAGIRHKLEAQNKKVIDNGLQIFAVKTLVQAVQNNNWNSIQKNR